MFKHFSYLTFVGLLVFLSFLQGCGSSGSSTSGSTNTPSTQPPVTEDPPEPITFNVQTETILNSDGPNTGLDAYSLIENVFSAGAIEAPDFYSGDHTSVTHIIEEEDDSVGPHFVFLAHRDLDFNKGVESDRQRNEIKAYDKSDVSLLAFENQTLQYSWKFKVSSEQELSSRFTHFFQIKARNENEDDSNGNDDQPMVTISAAEKSSTGNELQVRFSTGNNPDGTSTSDTYLATIDWFTITDEWLEVFVQATFADDEQGALKLTITRMSDEKVMIDIDESAIDMWRGVSEQDFARPKWGIYRSISETSSLRAEEEKVRFADFIIRKGTVAN
jgi:hypothetical protein